MATNPKVAVEVAFDGGPFSSSYTWTDISEYVKGFTVRRGRNNELDRIEAGTLSLSLDNSDGRFTPGKAKFGANIFAAFQDKVSWDCNGRANNTILTQQNLNLDDISKSRIMSRTVYTNGKPVSCYFSVKWLDAAGATLRWFVGTRFVADNSPAVYTHEEAQPVGAVKATFYIYADMYPEGNEGLTVYGEKAEWYQTQPYYPNVLPRRRVRVRTANLMDKDVSTGGDVSRSADFYYVAHSPATTKAYDPSTSLSGAGSVRVDFGNNGTTDYASSLYPGYASTGTGARGRTRVQGGATYSFAVKARLGLLSPDVSLKARIRWYDENSTYISLTPNGATTALQGDRYNGVFNPSFDVDLAASQTYGQAVITRARVTGDGAPVGSAVTACVSHTNTADNTTSSSGTTWDCEPISGTGTKVTASAWVKIPASGISRLFVVMRQGATTLKATEVLPLAPLAGAGWQKVEATYTLTAGQSVDRVGVACYGTAGTVWWADAAQVVVGDGPTGTYADGSFSGYHWAGGAYASPTVSDSWEPRWQEVSVLDQTAPANAVWSVVQVGTAGNTLTPYVHFDEAQMEQGPPLSDWNPGGSIFYGYIEKWPVTSEGLTATADVSAVDGFSVLANTDLRTAFQDQVLSTGPTGYWTLADPVDSVRLENLADDQKPARLVPSKFGGGTAQFGAETIVRNDPATCYSLTNIASNQGTVVDICEGGMRNYPLDAEFSVGFWCQPVYPSSGETSTLFRSWADNANDHLSVQLNSSGRLIASMRFAEGISTATSTVSASSSKPTFVVVTVKTGLTSIWINGSLNVTSSIGTVMNEDVRDMRWSSLGGAQAGSVYESYANGRYGHLAVWNRSLTSTEILTMWRIGDYNGADFVEDEKARLTRIATMAIYNGETAFDAPKSVLQGPSWSSGAKALDELQGAAEDASGYLFMDGDGRLTYHNRDRRQGAPVRFELSDSRGLPYEPGLQFEMDEDRIINEVTYRRVNGIEGVVKDQASIAAYGRKSKSVELRVTSDSAVQDAAYALMNSYARPIVRCDSVTLKATATPGLFLVALGVEIGDRVTLSDLPSVAPESSLGYYVEAIDTEVSVNGSALEWVTTLSLSPAEGSDVWVLEDPALGRLDRTTVLAY
ncbi:LamG-like jellyroll fold domain-containing protein [Streptomyces sp. NPDC048430]|uniref:LamG-like jellyroll fold domain-containing protein n=1 Tax=Streptomyces sp. NPDC048430 TaxID=3155388 RepID=UPI0034357FC2